jgi:hypothetical protein
MIQMIKNLCCCRILNERIGSESGVLPKMCGEIYSFNGRLRPDRRIKTVLDSVTEQTGRSQWSERNSDRDAQSQNSHPRRETVCELRQPPSAEIGSSVCPLRLNCKASFLFGSPGAVTPDVPDSIVICVQEKLIGSLRDLPFGVPLFPERTAHAESWVYLGHVPCSRSMDILV